MKISFVHRKIRECIIFGMCLAISISVCAQESAPRPTELVVPELEVQRLGDELLESGLSEGERLDLAEPAVHPNGGAHLELQKSGRWKVSPHLDLRATYDDNIFIDERHKVSDLVLMAAPGIAIGIWNEDQRLEHFLNREQFASFIERHRGNFLILDYTAILLGFSKTRSENAFDQDLVFDAQWAPGKMSLSARVHLESKSEPNLDVGDRVRRNSVASSVSARYAISEKTAIEAVLANRIEDPENYLRSVESRIESYLDYEMTPLARVSIGLALGRVEVEAGADQVFERILSRAIYTWSEKLRFAARGGVEFRQSDGALGDRTNPILDFEAEYEPAAATRVALEAHRRVETSALQPDQDFVATGFVVKIRRALDRGLHLTLAGGYELAEYSRSEEGDRSDRFFFVRPGLLYNFAAWGNVELSYEYRANDSTRSSSEFVQNQVSIKLSLVY